MYIVKTPFELMSLEEQREAEIEAAMESFEYDLEEKFKKLGNADIYEIWSEHTHSLNPQDFKQAILNNDGIAMMRFWESAVESWREWERDNHRQDVIDDL